MAACDTVDSIKRMFTTHGTKKFQGAWVKLNGVPSLTFVHISGEEIEVLGGEEIEVLGYTTIDEIIRMAYSPDLPNIII